MTDDFSLETFNESRFKKAEKIATENFFKRWIEKRNFEKAYNVAKDFKEDEDRIVEKLVKVEKEAEDLISKTSSEITKFKNKYSMENNSKKRITYISANSKDCYKLGMVFYEDFEKFIEFLNMKYYPKYDSIYNMVNNVYLKRDEKNPVNDSLIYIYKILQHIEAMIHSHPIYELGKLRYGIYRYIQTSEKLGQ